MARLGKTLAGKVQGLGAAKEGVGHFWQIRVTSVALIPLTVWFLVSVVMLAGQGHGAVLAFLANPINAALMLLFLLAGLLHSALGVQTVIEDYIAVEGSKIALLIVNTFFHFAAGAACAVAVLQLAA
jgi:succinate dehydrogenase / fumarate reductase membrane anchor subunit